MPDPEFDSYERKLSSREMFGETTDPERHKSKADRKGDWMQTFTGKQFWPLDPRPEDIDIKDIAHALSMTCRYGGHCIKFYSVAEHSVLVSRAVRKQDALWGLLHDASEAYISDIIRPVKPYLANYKEIENSIMAVICQRFDLPTEPPASLKWADEAILADEADQVMGAPPQDWNLRYAPIGATIRGLTPYEAEMQFLNRFHELTAQPAQAEQEEEELPTHEER